MSMSSPTRSIFDRHHTTYILSVSRILNVKTADLPVLSTDKSAVSDFRFIFVLYAFYLNAGLMSV